MQRVAHNTEKEPPAETCLIIEDSDFDQQRMTRIIRKYQGKLRITAVPTLKAARKVLFEEHVVLILLDNNLPDGVGADFAVTLSRNAQYSDIPVIIVTDWPSPFMWEKAASAGVQYVLNKAEFDARYVHAALKASKQRKRRIG
jgi:response regulator RpfG family c-di-GMP phosphodiesterase